MNSILLKNKISDFWEWFVEHEEKFREITDPEAAREMLDNQVLQFGVFSWEIGEGQRKPYTFTISPNGNAKMLRISEAVIGEAPELKMWEFYAAKPAQDWDFTFEMFDSFMVKRQIDAAEWDFILKATDDEKVRVLLFADNIDFLDADDKLSAADFVLNKIIGEMDKIYYVDSVAFMDFVVEGMEEDLQPLVELQSVFEGLM